MTVFETVEFDDSADRPAGLSNRTLGVTVVAMDPSVYTAAGRLLRTKVSVTTDRLEPGPRSHRFFVVDYDTTAQRGFVPAVLTEAGTDGGWRWVDRFADASDEELETSAEFRAQNVWAIASSTLTRFERALGRRLPWAFGGHHLHLVPAAFEEPNAYYAPEQKAVLFGYVDAGPGRPAVYTSLARDAVAHEVTHAILDGLRPRLAEPGLPDQVAFHEGFADIVALLSILSAEEVIANCLGAPDPNGRIPDERVTRKALERNVLFGVAKQLGSTITGGRSGALRRSVELEATSDWLSDPHFDEPHNRGEILVAAIGQTLINMWVNRLRPIIYAGGLDLDRAAEEGAKAASHLLEMSIRAIDYTPPIELEFGDFVDAVLLADEIIAPDDRLDYRGAITAGFAAFGIHPPQRAIIDLDAVPHRLLYDRVNHDALRVDPDEIFQFIWHNADVLGINPAYYLDVERVRHATRTGPDGLVVTEILADYIQMFEATLGEFVHDDTWNLELPNIAGLDHDTRVQVFGGGVLVFDQFGKARYHQTKPINDPIRQQRRLDHLTSHGLADTKNRFGFSYGERRGQRFSALHAPTTRAGESW